MSSVSSGAGREFLATDAETPGLSDQILFDPIIHTSRQRVLGHHCIGADSAAAVRAAARQSGEGFYFIRFAVTSMDAAIQAISKSGLPHSRVVFVAPEGCLHLCERYRDEGFAFAVELADDPPECSTALRDFRPSWMMLDKRLVHNVSKCATAAAIHKYVEASDQLGAPLIATGVERLSTVENLWLLGVEIMQGSLFGRPEPNILMHSSGGTGR